MYKQLSKHTYKKVKVCDMPVGLVGKSVVISAGRCWHPVCVNRSVSRPSLEKWWLSWVSDGLLLFTVVYKFVSSMIVVSTVYKYMCSENLTAHTE